MGDQANPMKRKHSLRRRSTKQLKPSLTDPNQFNLNAPPRTESASALGMNPQTTVGSLASQGILGGDVTEEKEEKLDA